MVEPFASDEATAGRPASEFTRRGGSYPIFAPAGVRDKRKELVAVKDG
jgi:hypothetical protein